MVQYFLGGKSFVATRGEQGAKQVDGFRAESG